MTKEESEQFYRSIGATIVNNETPLTLDYLENHFKIPKPTKTLKIEVKDGSSLLDSTFRAYNYVQNNLEGYNRVEFKFGPCYIVVAKLKD